MLNASLGEEALKDGIRSYLQSSLNGYASHSVLWSSLQEAARAQNTLPDNLELETLMEPWITLPGYPVLFVERDYEKGEFTVSQVSFCSYFYLCKFTALIEFLFTASLFCCSIQQCFRNKL